MQQLSDRVERLIEPLLQDDGIKLCEIRVSGRFSRPLIQLFVDHETDNISINKCVDLSRHVQDLLDMQEWVTPDYRLEVSSPGIDSPMKELWQFKKNIGRLIRLHSEELTFEGRLIEVSTQGLFSFDCDGDRVERQFKDMVGAKVVLELFSKSSVKRKRKH